MGNVLSSKSLTRVWETVVVRLKTAILAYSSLFFINDSRVGITLFILSFYNLDVGIAGFWGIVSLHIFDHLIGQNDEMKSETFLTYNSLLVSMGVGYVFSVDQYVLFIISFLSIITYLMTTFIKNVFYKYQIPVLSTPFCLVMLLFYMAKGRYANLYYNINPRLIFELNVPFLSDDWSLFFKSIGVIIFSPYEITGIGIFLLIIFRSRNMAFIMIVSFYYGVWIERFLTPVAWSQVSLIYSYNHILVAVGLCSVFMLPTLKSLLVMPFAVFFSILLNDGVLNFFRAMDLPVFTIPFNFALIIFLYSLRVLKFKNFPTSYGNYPEATLDWTLLDRINKKYDIKVFPPFFGKSDIYQSFDDEWTHTGNWKHALDFVVKDSSGANYKGSHLQKENYYCFGFPVQSPIDGVVTSLCLTYRDNEIGCVDTHHNWGNYIFIYSNQGFYVLLCHLKQHSSLLTVGAQVNAGDTIALCGNSGYSPEPHLHMHVQVTPYLGDKTVPFLLNQYINGTGLVFNQIPEKGESIRYNNFQKYSHALSYYLEKRVDYYVVDHIKDCHSKLTIIAELDKISGKFYLKDLEENRIYITRKNSSVSLDYFEGKADSPLAFIYSCIPKIPYYYEPGLQWTAPLACSVSLSRVKRYFRMFFSYFFLDLKYDFAQLSFTSKEGEIVFESICSGLQTKGMLTIDDFGDIKEISSNRFSLKKVSQ